ncbi:hypothetical protein [Dyella sp. 20L07]|uniref:hypothetical protein n=1 Tax=Dyella sp. 20L07 TaxID=3384240 RepID=UPI003D2C7AFA
MNVLFQRAGARQLAVLLACLVFGAALSVAMGQDTFWDTKNYHLYNAWAFLHDRYASDITVAGMQSYFNPLPDVPYFLLAHGPLSTWPRTLAAIQGLWFGVLMFVVLRIAAQLAQLQQRRFGMADVCAALIGVTGTMAVSQVGSTTNEIPLAVLLLLGFYLLLSLLSPSASRPVLRALLAGLCCGLAAGFKPTAVVYPPAMALALLAALDWRSRRAWTAAVVYTAGVAIAFVLAYGGWAWHLYQVTGNPIFPMFNQVFQSPLTAAIGGTDGQFRPHSLGQWLFYPFYWVVKQRNLVTEPVFADPRYALAMLAVLAIAVAKWIRARRTPDPALRLLVIFVAISYLLWMALFSILRYAIPIEALTGLLVLAAAHAWWPQQWQAPTRIAKGCLLGLLVLILATTTYPNWWRGGYSAHVVETDIAPLEPHSLVVLAGSPVAYLAPWFPQADDLQFVGLTWFTRRSQGYGLWNLTQQRLNNHAGPMYVVRRDDAAAELALLQELLPQRHMTDCHPIQSNLETGRGGKDHSLGLSLCKLIHD